MNFEQLFQNTLRWNIEAWGHIFQLFSKLHGSDAALMCEIAKAGIKQNYAVLKLAEQIKFMPGDEESAEAEAAFFNQYLERKQDAQDGPVNIPVTKSTGDTGRDKDIAELERIISLDSERIKKLDPNWYNDFLKREQSFDANIKTDSADSTSKGNISGDETKGPDEPKVQS